MRFRELSIKVLEDYLSGGYGKALHPFPHTLPYTLSSIWLLWSGNLVIKPVRVKSHVWGA